MPYASAVNADVSSALTALQSGRPVIVADDADRENEADVVMSAQTATSHWVGWTISNSSGLLCAPMTSAVANRLELPPMVLHNRDPRGTAYTVTVDARAGVGTGIGARDRTCTLNLLASREAGPADFVRPGHVLPLRGHPDGLLGRRGHTEAAIALCDMAGLQPVGVIAEVVGSDGEPLAGPDARQLAVEYSLPFLHIDGLAAAYQIWREGEARGAPTTMRGRVVRRETATISNRYGDFEAIGYYDCATGDEHVALLARGPRSSPETLVRIHSQCMTGESLGSTRCDCAGQLEAALALTAEHGGVVIYLAGQEGRGIGLTAKLAAYRLQQHLGLDTIDANLAIDAPVDAREYGAAAAILDDLGIFHVRLMTGNPAKAQGLIRAGIAVAGSFPLMTDPTPANQHYLETKRTRLGHVC